MNLYSIVQSATVAAIAAMSVAGSLEALAQESPRVQSKPVQAVTGSVQQITLELGKGGVFKTSAPYSKLSVGDEKIVEVTPQSDLEFVFTPKGLGTTNVLIFDAKSTLIATLDINVIDSLATPQQAHEETFEDVPGRVRIYNVKGTLAASTTYQCIRTNCELVGQAPSAGPAGGPATAR